MRRRKTAALRGAATGDPATPGMTAPACGTDVLRRDRHAFTSTDGTAFIGRGATGCPTPKSGRSAGVRGIQGIEERRALS
jgi:hypothetical protein